MISKEINGTALLNQALTKLGRNLNFKLSRENTIVFTLPSSHVAQHVFPRERIKKVFAQLVIKANDFLINDMGLIYNGKSCGDVQKTNYRECLPVSSWVIVSGAFKGLFTFGFDKTLADYLADKFIVGGLEEDEDRDELFADAITEVVNVVIGGASDMFHDSLGNSILEVPVTIWGDVIKCRGTNVDILAYCVNSDHGRFEIMAVVS